MSTCCNKCGEPHCICHIAFPSDFSLEHAVSKMRDSRTIAKLEAELSATQQKLEAAEARIKASQEQEPSLIQFSHAGHCEYGITTSDMCNTSGCSPKPRKLYAAPVIPPDVAELQRENEELTRKLAEQQALFSKLTLMAWPNGNKEFLGEAGFEELTKLLAEAKSKAVPDIKSLEIAINKLSWDSVIGWPDFQLAEELHRVLSSSPQPETDRGSNETGKNNK